MKGLLIGLFFTLFYSCSSPPQTDSILKKEEIWIIDEGWKAENNKDYFIQFPSDWTLEKSEFGNEGGFRIISPKTSKKDSIFENIMLYRQPVRQDTRIDFFGARSVNNNQFEYGRDYKVHSRELITKPNYYYRIDATLKSELLNIRGIQYIMKRESSIFVLTLTCAPNTFENYQEIGEKIMQSFIPKESFWIKNPKPYL